MSDIIVRHQDIKQWKKSVWSVLDNVQAFLEEKSQ